MVKETIFTTWNRHHKSAKRIARTKGFTTIRIYPTSSKLTSNILRFLAIHIELKLKILFVKTFTRFGINDFRLKKFVNFFQTRSVFLTVIEDMLKMTLLPLAKLHF